MQVLLCAKISRHNERTHTGFHRSFFSSVTTPASMLTLVRLIPTSLPPPPYRNSTLQPSEPCVTPKRLSGAFLLRLRDQGEWADQPRRENERECEGLRWAAGRGREGRAALGGARTGVEGSWAGSWVARARGQSCLRRGTTGSGGVLGGQRGDQGEGADQPQAGHDREWRGLGRAFGRRGREGRAALRGARPGMEGSCAGSWVTKESGKGSLGWGSSGGGAVLDGRRGDEGGGAQQKKARHGRKETGLGWVLGCWGMVDRTAWSPSRSGRVLDAGWGWVSGGVGAGRVGARRPRRLGRSGSNSAEVHNAQHAVHQQS